jgi:disease resistance protein RPS2
MLFQRIIKVKPFSSEEAWTLYMDNLERDKTLPLGEKQIAKSITRECGGLPLGIKTMVGAMGGSD